MLWFQFVVNGLIAGAIISLVAGGFSLIYATNRFVHFAHGTVVTMSAYLLYTFFTLVHLNFYLAAILAVVGAGMLGALLYVVVYAPLRKRGASTTVLLMASIGLMILLENVPLVFFGPSVKSLDFLQAQKGISIMGAFITPLQIIILAVSVILLLALWFFVRYSKAGTIIRAVADNPELALISGIPVPRVQLLSFVIASGIAGVAAVLIALEQNVAPLMGTNLIIKSFAAAVIGGAQSLPGAILGSYLVGFAENLGIIWLPSAYKEAITFTLLLLFLLVRPQGILGLKKRI